MQLQQTNLIFLEPDTRILRDEPEGKTSNLTAVSGAIAGAICNICGSKSKKNLPNGSPDDTLMSAFLLCNAVVHRSEPISVHLSPLFSFR